MKLLFCTFFLIVGFILLIKGADYFVDGSSSFARLLNIPSIIIGLTIVAMGTSAPELAVSTIAAVNGSNEIAISNVVGSNIFNILIILGLCTLIRPVKIYDKILKRDFPITVFSTFLVLIFIGYPFIRNLIQHHNPGIKMSQTIGVINRMLSITLLIIFICYIAMLIYSTKKNQKEPEKEESKTHISLLLSIVYIIGGLIAIIIGGQLVVNNAKQIASSLGMTETLIGVTIIAFGTSLPELATSIIASKKGEDDLAIGNVIGSNIFNMLLILGVSGIIHPINVNLASLIDTAFLLLISSLVYIFSLKRRINRIEGAIMVILYIANLAFAIIR